jgi:hypothetical protein
MADPVAVIQATLAPAFLISGTGILLNFSQTRLFRVLDRSRAIAAGHGDEAARPGLLRRAHILRNAIALGVLAVALTVVTAVLLMASQMFGHAALAAAAPYAFALAMVALLAALVLVLWDTVLSVRGIEARR